MFHQFYGSVITVSELTMTMMEMEEDKHDMGVGRLPAVSNRIMEIIERRPSVFLLFAGRSVLNHLRLGLAKRLGEARSHFVPTSHFLTTTLGHHVKTSGRRRFIYHNIKRNVPKN